MLSRFQLDALSQEREAGEKGLIAKLGSRASGKKEGLTTTAVDTLVITVKVRISLCCLCIDADP